MTRLTGWIISTILILYSFACVVAIIHFSKTTEIIFSTNLKKTGDMIGPFEAKKANSVYIISVKQFVKLNEKSAIDVGIYDKNEKYLFSFNMEMWHESGYDKGYWDEDTSTYELAINFSESEKYSLDVSVGNLKWINVLEPTTIC